MRRPQVADEQKITVFIAQADEVVAGRDDSLRQLMAGMVGRMYARIETPGGTYTLWDHHSGGVAGERAPIPPRWRASIQDGVLTVRAWRDVQDRETDEPETVLVLPAGGWDRIIGPVRYIDDSAAKS
jgi:hypothetical protein